MSFTVVFEFESDSLFFLVMDLLYHICQFQGVAHQAAEGGGELVEWRFVHSFFIHLLEDGLAAFEHIVLEIEVEAVTLAGAAPLVCFAQF